MIYKSIISIAALLDIEEAIERYQSINSNLGNHIELSIYEGLEELELNPFICSKKYKEVRVKFIRRFPYGVHYIIDENQIKVFGFLHMKRNPSKWNERLEK
jgi:hypothetical protein